VGARRGPPPGETPSALRRAALDRAARAETAVAEYVDALGYTIVARNLRLGRLELDLVARDGRTVVVVEVRTRAAGAYTTAFGSIDRAKRARVRRAGERLWRERYRHDPSVDHLRFDAASVTFQGSAPRVSYCRAAF
jgi:putative endonuclease